MTRLQQALTLTSVIEEQRSVTSEFLTFRGENLNIDIMEAMGLTTRSFSSSNSKAEFNISTLQEINTQVNQGSSKRSLNIFTKVWNQQIYTTTFPSSDIEMT